MAVVSRRATSTLTVDRPPTPLSPKSALVHRQISSMPPVAVVHGANFDVLKASEMYPSSPEMSSPVLPYLSDAKGAYSPSGVQPKTPLMDISLSDAHPSERVVMRRAVKRATSVPTIMVPVAKDDEIRVLSKAEQDQRAKEAVKHFRHMAVINNRSRTVEEFDLAMAKIRKKKLTSMSTIEGDAKASGSDAKRLPSKEAKAEPPKAQTKAEAAKEVKDVEPTPEPEEKPKSLADRMGFGVKTKAQNKWGKLKSAVSMASSLNSAVAASKTMTGAKTGVGVGSTDLKAVLAAKREKAADEMKAFEKMNLPVQEFVQTFRSNVDLVMKVAKTTGIPYGDLKALDNPTLISWFHQMDTDNSGTLDFAEFIEGLMKVSQTQDFQDKMLARRDTVG